MLNSSPPPISISTVVMPNERFEVSLAHIMAAGWDMVDLDFWTKFGIRFDFSNAAQSDKLKFIERLNAFGLRVLGINSHHSLWGSENWANAYEFYSLLAEFLSDLGSQHFTIQLGETLNVKKLPENYVQNLVQLNNQLSKYNLQLLLEIPHPRYGCGSFEDLKVMADLLPKNIGVTLDTGHIKNIGATFQHVENIFANDRIFHIHLKNPHHSIEACHQIISESPINRTFCVEIEESSYNFEELSESIRNNYRIIRQVASSVSAETLDYYDSCAMAYDEQRYEHLADMKLLQKYLMSLDDHDTGFILDVGCGSGVSCEVLLKNAEVIGIDVSQKLLNIARARYGENFIGVCMNVEQLPARQAKFNGVILVNCLHHLEPKEQLSLFQKLLGFIKPGGFLYFVYPMTSPENNVMTFLNVSMPCITLEISTFQSLLKMSNFAIVLEEVVDSSLNPQKYSRRHYACVAKRLAGNTE